MKKTVALVAPLALAALLPLGAAAQTAEPWKFTGILYAYLPSVSGKTVFSQGGGGGSDVGVDASQLIDKLNFAFMGSLQAQKGQWGAFTDYVYFDIGGSASGTRDLTVGRMELPAGASASADLDLKGSAWTLGGSYRAVSAPAGTLDVLFGARLLDIKQTLGWSLSGNVGSVPLTGRAGNLDAKISNWDGIVGIKGRVSLGEGGKWFAPYYLDVGAGNSDLTWQAMAGVGYAFGWGDVVALWRYLDYKMKSGSKIEDLSFNGPAIAAVFHW